MRAEPPVHDFRCLDAIAAVRRRHQTWCGLCAAVDVVDRAALPADGVVMSVARTRIKQGGESGRLQAPHQAVLAERCQSVVDRLRRHGAQLSAHMLHDPVRRGVRQVLDGAQHGKALNCDVQAAGSQPIEGVGGHGQSYSVSGRVLDSADHMRIILTRP